jgi:GNAT superfamily N-acetyltransferase
MPPHSDGAAPTGLEVRRPTVEDLPAIVRIWQEGWADAHVGHVPPGLLRFRHHAHFAALAHDRLAAMWVTGPADTVAGFVVVKGDEIEQLYVDRPSRGTGLAATLLGHAEAEIGRAGHARAWLAVVAGNRRARAFYARLGWRDAGPMSYMADTADGPFAVPTHRYVIDLSRSHASR